jgi:hypothetical protein
MIAGGEISIFPSVLMRVELRRIFRPTLPIFIESDLPDGRKDLRARKTCRVPRAKINRFSIDPNHSYPLAVSSHQGAYRDRHGRGAGCGGRGSVGRAKESQAGFGL